MTHFRFQISIVLIVIIFASRISAAETSSSAKYLFETAIDLPIKDLSGNGHDATAVAPDTCWVNTDIGPAIELKDPHSLIDIPSRALPPARGTVRVHFRADSDLSDTQVLFRVYKTSENGLSLDFKNQRLRLRFYNPISREWTSVALSKNAIRPGAWADVLLSWDFIENKISLGLVGLPAVTTSLEGFKPSFSESSSVTLGNERTGTSTFRGVIRSLDIYDKPAWELLELQGTLDTPPSAADLESHDFGNDRIRLQFSKTTGALLEMRQLRPANTALVAAPLKREDLKLWKIRFADDYGRGSSSIWTLSDSKRPPVFEQKEDGRDKLLTIFWPEVTNSKGESGEVRVTVRLTEGDSIPRWRLSSRVHSSTRKISSVEFPLITLNCFSPHPEQMRFVQPARWGQAIPDPFFQGVANPQPSYETQLTYPASAMFQFFALTAPERTGLYLATYDSEGFTKEYRFSALPASKRMSCTILHFPDDRSRSSFELSYDVAIGSFQGDWFDATQIYKSWAVKQKWCEKGSLARRKDTPQWLLGCHLALRASTVESKTQAPISAVAGIKIAEAFGGPLINLWYNWWKKDRLATVQNLAKTTPKTYSQAWAARSTIPDEGVEDALRRMKDAGIFSCAYLNSVVFDQGMHPDDFARSLEKAIQRGPQGEIMLYNDAIMPMWRMDRSSPLWQDYLVQQCREIIKQGFKGVYLDSFGRAAPPSYTEIQGIPPGSGLAPLTGQIALVEKIKAAVRDIDPEAVLSAEANTENFVGLIDANLYHYNLVSDGVPIWAALFHEYQIAYGRHMNPAQNEDIVSFRQGAGNLFVMGALLGRIFVGNTPDPFPLNGSDKLQRQFVENALTLRKHFHAQLVLGSLLRPVEISPPPERIPLKTKHYDFPWPDLLTQTWADPQGEPVIFFVNCSNEDREIKARFSPEEYGRSKEKWNLVRQNSASNPQPVAFFSNGEFTLKLAAGEIVACTFHKKENQ